MKKNYVNIIGRTFLMTVVILTAAFGLIYAQEETAGSDDSNSSGNGRFEGTWDVRVTIRNCNTGDEIRSFDSLTTFMSGGTLVDSTSGVWQALKTPGHGVWSHINKRSYRFSFKSFNFDPAGNYTGYTIIRHQATLSQRANDYTSAGTSEIYNPNGTLLFTGCSTTTAVRFE